MIHEQLRVIKSIFKSKQWEHHFLIVTLLAVGIKTAGETFSYLLFLTLKNFWLDTIVKQFEYCYHISILIVVITIFSFAFFVDQLAILKFYSNMRIAFWLVLLIFLITKVTGHYYLALGLYGSPEFFNVIKAGLCY